MSDGPAAPRPSAGKRILTYGAALIVAAVVSYGLTEFLTPVQKPNAGDCAYLTGAVGEGRYNAVDCAAPNANYVVAGTVARTESCPNPAEAAWEPVRFIDPTIRFCLVPRYDEGGCYDEAGPDYDINAVDCGGDTFRVTRVSTEVPAPACATGEQTRAFPEAKLTYCIAAR